MKTEPLEIEVKFYLTDTDVLRNRILELGAQCEGKVFETNIRFEDADNSLIQKKSLLRLRKDTTAKLTFKSNPPVKDNQFKIRREWEVEVSDFSIMKHILESLGFHKEQIYEKWRETFVLNSTHFCIDTMPYGNFLEIEGEKADIKFFASELGLTWENRILTNYLAIFSIIRQDLNLNFSDVTFDNFKHIYVDFSKYVDVLSVKS